MSSASGRPERPRAAPASVARERDLAAALRSALTRRRRLLDDPETDVCRLFNDRWDGVDGLVVERLGEVLIAQCHLGRLAVPDDALRDALATLAEAVGAPTVYRKLFPRDRTNRTAAIDAANRDPTPWIGPPAPAAFAVREHGLNFMVRPFDGFSTGLFLDHREQRRAIRRVATGKRVLDTFAYTGGFTVAAAAGGADHVITVDVSKRYLNWARENVSSNSVTECRHLWYCCDVFDGIRRLARAGLAADIIILDPPTFARLERPHRTFTLERDLHRLLVSAVGVLSPGGLLHLSANAENATPAWLKRALTAAALAAGRRVEWLDAPTPPADFAGDEACLKVLWARLR